jgi:type II secretory pathway pseudopilin PulG
VQRWLTKRVAAAQTEQQAAASAAATAQQQLAAAREAGADPAAGQVAWSVPVTPADNAAGTVELFWGRGQESTVSTQGGGAGEREGGGRWCPHTAPKGNDNKHSHSSTSCCIPLCCIALGSTPPLELLELCVLACGVCRPVVGFHGSVGQSDR